MKIVVNAAANPQAPITSETFFLASPRGPGIVGPLAVLKVGAGAGVVEVEVVGVVEMTTGGGGSVSEGMPGNDVDVEMDWDHKV